MNETRTHGSRPGSQLASLLCAVLLAAPCLLAAQESAAPAAPGGREMPRPDELEPGVNTTPKDSAPAPAAPASAAATSAAPPAAAAAAGAGPKSPAARQNEKSGKAAGRKGPDRLELDTTDITGNRELPKVLYIVPWKRSDLGDVVGKPVNSLLDEVLQPLDRDVFRRENRYYDALEGGAGGAKPGTPQGSPNKP